MVVPSGPTAAQLAVRKRAALRAQRRRAARKRAAQVAARKVAARKRAREAKQTVVAPQAKTGESKTVGFSDPESGTSNALPFLLAGLFAGALLLGAALTPAHTVPWPRAARVLHDRRQELALLGAAGLLATGFFFLLATTSSA